MTKQLNIGIFGFGCVGQGLYNVLSKSTGTTAEIAKICVKDRAKKRPLPENLFTFDKNEILSNPKINLIVELIDDADEAFLIVSEALKMGKNVVTANKKMVATHLRELVQLQEQFGASLLYEASSCGSIPIIRTLEEYFDNEQLSVVNGIFNGTSNYILTKTISEGLTYAEALKKAQDLGFAETDPTSDVEGYDAKYKSIIIAAHAFGVFALPEEVLNIGIENVSTNDIVFAQQRGLKLKLVPTIKRLENGSIAIFVLPQFVSNMNNLYFVENECNGVVIEGLFSDKQFLSGKGAGGNPTGSAVLSDVSAVTYDYRYEYKKHKQNNDSFTNDVELEVYLRVENNSSLAEKFEFSEISERFTGSQYCYIIGKLKLKKLIELKSELKRKKLFVAVTDPSTIALENRIKTLKSKSILV